MIEMPRSGSESTSLPVSADTDDADTDDADADADDGDTDGTDDAGRGVGDTHDRLANARATPLPPSLMPLPLPLPLPPETAAAVS
jgi:hypothetical protein